MSMVGDKRRGLTVGQKLVLIIGGPLLLQLAISFAIGEILNRVERLAQYEHHSKEFLGRTNWLGYVLTSSIVTCIGRTLDPVAKVYDDAYRSCRAELAKELPAVSKLFADAEHREDASKNVDRINGIVRGIEGRMDAVDRSTALSPENRVDLLIKSKELHDYWKDFREARSALLAADRSPFAVGPADERSTRNFLKMFIYIGAATNILMALAMAVLLGISLAKRIKVLTENTRRLGRNEQLQEPIGGADELAELDETFHSMADALRQARHKERAIFENTADVICVLGPDGVFKQTSPAARLAWGYQPGELEGKSWQVIVAEDNLPRSEAFIAEALRKETPVTAELGLSHKDGRNLEFRWSGSWSKEHQSLFCVAHDVSEQKKVERLKREFVQIVSHDLRSPLTSIQGFLVMVQNGVYGDVPEKVNTKARQSSTDLDRLIGLISNLLDLDKLEEGSMQLLLKETTTADLIERAVASIEAMAEMNDVTLVYSNEALPLVCDDMQIVQVLVNLVSNAIKFSPPDSKVDLDAAKVGMAIEFRVSDHGRGIPEESQAAIFDRFKQVKAEDGRVKRGTGLGLAICKAIVTAHHGEIGVRSEVGKGSTFWFRLPSVPSA